MSSPSMTYLDFAASAPLRDVAREALAAYDEQPYAGANPNSLHTPGRQAARALDGARASLARCLGGRFRPSEIVFTSGGTESNNLALLGLAEAARGRDGKRSRVLVSAIEHDSVLDVAQPLRSRGFSVELIPTLGCGRVDLTALEAMVGRDVALVSVMAANNETGIIQPYEEAARIAHGAGALMHVDAVQGFGRMALTLDEIDAVSLAAHKIGGPVGVGALALRNRVRLRPQSFGGGQEGGLRAGTQDVRGSLGFAAAAEECCAQLQAWRSQVASRSQGLVDRLVEAGAGIEPTVAEPMGGDRLPGIVSLLVSGLSSDMLVLALDARGFAVSAGSACSSGSVEASHVLTAMGIPRELARCSLRVSFDERVGNDRLEAFSDALLSIVKERSHRT